VSSSLDRRIRKVEGRRLRQRDPSQLHGDELARIVLRKREAGAADLSDEQLQATVVGGSDEPWTS
jgi:hypothetical protein